MVKTKTNSENVFFKFIIAIFKVLICSKISSTLFFVFTSLAAISLYFLPETYGMTLAQTLEEAEMRFRESKISHSCGHRRPVPTKQSRDNNAAIPALKH